MRKILPFVATALLALGLFVAAETALPHDFEAGDLLSAAAMNENFAALAGAIDALAATSQRRVAEGCGEGAAIRAIAANGSVVCEERGGEPGPAGADGSSVRAELERGDLTICNDAGTREESCTTERVQGRSGRDGVVGYGAYVNSYAYSAAAPLEAGDVASMSVACPDGEVALSGGGGSTEPRVVLRSGSLEFSGQGERADSWRGSFINLSGDDLAVEIYVTVACAEVG